MIHMVHPKYTRILIINSISQIEKNKLHIMVSHNQHVELIVAKADINELYTILLYHVIHGGVDWLDHSWPSDLHAVDLYRLGSSAVWRINSVV